jgi:hypothetical protein
MTVPVLLLLMLTGYSSAWMTMVSLWAFAYVLYGLIQIFFVFPTMGSWAAAVMPQTNTRMPNEELKAKLFSLNDENLPFAVTQDSEKSERLVVSWKIADEKWIELFAARGLRIQYELRMKIDENKGRVLAQDYLRRFQYTAGLRGGDVKFSRQFSFFKGIQLFQYEQGVQYGVICKNGQLKIDYAYDYKFSIEEVKNPIIQIVTSSGWEYRPVVSIR